MKRHARVLIAAAAYLLFVLYAMDHAGRAQESVYPESAGMNYCDGMPPIYGTDC